MIVDYGKSFRASKTSEKYEVEDISFFLYNNKSVTKGITEVYADVGSCKPLVFVCSSNEKAKLWLQSSKTRVKSKLAVLDTAQMIKRDMFISSLNKKVESVYESNDISLEECQAMHNEIIKEVKRQVKIK